MAAVGWVQPAIEAAHDARMYDIKRGDFRQDRDSARQFDKRMANSVHQREVMDLEKAGLNPILSAGGNGAPAPTSAGPAGIETQPIHMPDLFAYGIDLKKLEQQDRLIKVQENNSAASISNKMSDTDLNKMKKILAQKGMVKAQLEGEASTVMSNMIKWLKESVQKNKQPFEYKQPDSSGGNIQQP